MSRKAGGSGSEVRSLVDQGRLGQMVSGVVVLVVRVREGGYGIVVAGAAETFVRVERSAV